ncbi:hypothetical protein ACFL54_03380 [Planctomycetota bacterium]
MDIKDFEKQVQKHKVIPAMLKDGHYIQKKPKEFQEAFEELIGDYNVDLIESLEKVTNANRRVIIIKDIIEQLKKLK